MQKILVIGDAILDIYCWGHINRMSPESAETPILDVFKTDHRLGGCLNVAANLKALEPQIEVFVLSVIDKTGKQMLVSKNIKHFPLTWPIENCVTKTRFVNIETEKQLLRLDNRLKFKEKDIKEINDSFEFMNLEEFDAIIISDYNKGIINPTSIYELSKCKPDTMFFIDTKNPDLSTWDVYNNCLLKINLVESQNRINNSIHPTIVTLGEKGAALEIAGKTRKIFSTSPVKNPEVTGCGDTFLAGLAVGYLRKKNLHKAIKFANVIASESARSFGTTEVSLEASETTI